MSGGYDRRVSVPEYVRETGSRSRNGDRGRRTSAGNRGCLGAGDVRDRAPGESRGGQWSEWAVSAATDLLSRKPEGDRRLLPYGRAVYGFAAVRLQHSAVRSQRD